MSLDTPHVLIDGTFSSPLAWLLVALTAVVLATPPLVVLFFGRRDPMFRRFAVLMALGVSVLSPFVLDLLVSVIGLSGSVLFCLLPTRHLVRDWSPAAIAVLSVFLLAWRLPRPSSEQTSFEPA